MGDIEAHISKIIWKEHRDKSRKAVVSVVLTIKNIFTENKSILYQTVQKRVDINCSPETFCSQTF